MENESGSGARCEKEVEYKNRFSEPTFLPSIDGGLAVYIYMYTRASAYARGLLGEIIHRTYLVRCKWAPSCFLK